MLLSLRGEWPPRDLANTVQAEALVPLHVAVVSVTFLYRLGQRWY